MEQNKKNEIKHKPKESDLPSEERGARKKRRNRFVDNCKNFWDKSRVGGYGEGKPLICDVCKKQVHKVRCGVIEGKIISICDNCEMPKELKDIKGTSNVVIH